MKQENHSWSTVKVKIADVMGNEAVSLTFVREEIEKLEHFMENFGRFELARLIEKGIPEINKVSLLSGGTVENDTEEPNRFCVRIADGFKLELSEFDLRDIPELLHLARPIFLVQEPASFERTCAIVGRRAKGTFLTEYLRFIRDLFDKGEYQSLFQLKVNSTPLFHERTLKSWLYGVWSGIKTKTNERKSRR